jgi:protein-S-isoprenylcysteine O-methyltransferase Ste14
MAPEKKDTPGVIIFPPLLWAGTLAFGFLAQWLWPIHLFHWTPLRWIGGAFAITSAVLAKSGENALRRAGTNIKPTEPTLAIVQDGPFRFSRNPLYLSLTILYVGVSFMFNAAWPMILLLPLLVVAQRGIIYREERYLQAKFGDEYLRYRSRVPRWF